jgi:hypothetical protein
VLTVDFLKEKVPESRGILHRPGTPVKHEKGINEVFMTSLASMLIMRRLHVEGD